MLSELFTGLYPATTDMTILDVCLRLLCALLIGVVIGTEREYTNRPAGMRTHMLVSLGACVIMVIGQLIFIQYHALGASPDPARMGAQVITGVGFLGAGTIMKEGATVKGLTTAASLWATACLGLAAGSGYYVVALTGMVFIFVTLTIFEIIQRKLVGSHRTFDDYRLKVSDISLALEAVSAEAASSGAVINNMHAELLTPGNDYSITFRADFVGRKSNEKKREFFNRLACRQGIVSIHTTGEYVGAGSKSK